MREYGKTYPPSIFARSTRGPRTSHSLSHLFFRAAECNLGFSSLKSVWALTIGSRVDEFFNDAPANEPKAKPDTGPLHLEMYAKENPIAKEFLPLIYCPFPADRQINLFCPLLADSEPYNSGLRGDTFSRGDRPESFHFLPAYPKSAVVFRAWIPMHE
jgi:hypothetical protein